MNEIIMNFFIKSKTFKSLSSDVRSRYGLLSGIVGIICNLLLCVSKLIIGLITGWISIIADSFNNLSDAGSSIVTLVGFKLSSAPPDEKHPFGHGRIEYIAGFIVSVIIFLMGFELIKSSIEAILNPQEATLNTLTFIILSGSILIKFWIYFLNKKLSLKINSAAIKATALDSLNDVVATLAVIVGILISTFTGLNLDGYIGITVSLFIIYTGCSTVKETFDLLLGKAPNIEFAKKIKEFIMSYDHVLGMHDLIINSYGPSKSIISLHLELPCNMDVLKMHDLVDNIEREMKKIFDCEVSIHMDPVVINDEKLNEIKLSVTKIVSNIDSKLDIHDFRMVKGTTHSKLIFDLVVPHRFKLNESELKETIEANVKKLNPSYETLITIDENFTPGI